MSQVLRVVVRTGEGTITNGGGFTDAVEIVERVPRQHSRWQSITYKWVRYQVFGGIRNRYYICLNNPITRRGY